MPAPAVGVPPVMTPAKTPPAITVVVAAVKNATVSKTGVDVSKAGVAMSEASMSVQAAACMHACMAAMSGESGA